MSWVISDWFISRVPDPALGGFELLPPDEQQWRARIYWAVYQMTGSAPYSWAIAMDRDPDEIAGMRQFLAETPDEVLMRGPTGGAP